VFNSSQLEYRVKQLEKTEKENAIKMDEQFEKVNARLDQIYAIMANK
jgi:predicted GIY-YIG superfamily endonuclease